MVLTGLAAKRLKVNLRVVEWSDLEKVDANGLKVSGELDCAKSAYKHSIGGQFKVDNDWLLHMEFLVPQFQPQWHPDMLGG